MRLSGIFFLNISAVCFLTNHHVCSSSSAAAGPPALHSASLKVRNKSFDIQTVSFMAAVDEKVKHDVSL